EYRILIKHCFLMGKTPERSLQWLEKCYPTSAPSRTTVYRWFSEFKMGRTSTEDAPRSGRPKEATNVEIVKQMHRIVLNDRKVKLRELAEAVGISKERAGYILHDVLEMKKPSARWVPRLLTVDQKQQRVDDSTAGLALLQRNRANFFRHFVTMDETWVHYHTPERDSDQMRKSSRKPRRILKAWTFRTTERASKCWKIAIPSVSPSKATMLRNEYNFTQKMLVFIENPGTFQPM
ncbi:Histone-lysine N-methyltransferase SETMAR, partial [Cyphomyrmex costatus]